MRRQLFTIYCLLLTTFLLSCTSRPKQSTQSFFYLYNFDHSAFVEFSGSFQPLRETPFSVPRDCSLLDVYPAPVGKYLLIEFSCPNGQTVLFLDTDSGTTTQPVTDTDSHFLAWSSDGKSAYLKVDSLGNTHIARLTPEKKNQFIPIAEYTYDLAASPTKDNFTFTFSRGMGQGSEIWLAKKDGKIVQQFYADQLNYISFARFSPDGKQIAFIKIPDTQTPFTVGELWVISADGSNPHKLDDADAGHGYAANWSPDGKQIAFVKRENTEDESANQSADSLISNIYRIDLESGKLIQATHFEKGRAETPHWSPDGNTLTFNAVIDGRMTVFTVDIATGQARSLITDASCCPAWIRK
jgi:Tol biopolymer transport system component